MLKLKLPVLAFVVGLIGVSVACKKDVDIAELEELAGLEEVEGDQRDRFVGSWTVSETRTKLVGTRSYTVKLEKDTGFPNLVNLYNLYLLGENTDSIRANVSSVEVDVITIPNQATVDSTYLIGGSGTMLDTNNITFNYTVDDRTGINGIDTVSATFVKVN